MTKYYMKDLPDNPVWVNGFPLRFDILETGDQTLINELDRCIARQAGGITALTKEQYDEEAKKKASGNNWPNNLKPAFKRTELSALQGLPVAGDAGNPNVGFRNGAGTFARPQQFIPNNGIQAANPSMPDPIEIPKMESFTIKPPPTAKASSLKN